MSSLIKFEKPPVAEVAFSVSFETAPPLPTAFIGLFWSKVRARFSKMEENAPYPVMIEPPAGAHVLPQQIQFQQLPVPHLRRTILSSQDGKHLIQIQQDKFILNWKRGDNDAYSDFKSAMADFDALLLLFEQTLASEGFGTVAYKQYELYYINLIGPENGFNVVDEGNVLIDHCRNVQNKRFLPPPTGYNWSSSYPLPDEAGRLHISALAVVVPPSSARHIRLDVVARGFPTKNADRGVWFDMAHDWIVNGFTDVTSPLLHQEVWKKI